MYSAAYRQLTFIITQNQPWIMVLVVDGNAEHVAHTYSYFLTKKIRFLTAPGIYIGYFDHSPPPPSFEIQFFFPDKKVCGGRGRL